jgi:hypothetical protein
MRDKTDFCRSFIQKFRRFRRRVPTNEQKADKNYLIDQQRIEV